MPAQPTASEMLPPLSIQNGVTGYLFGTRFIPRMAGAEDDPKPSDPKTDDEAFDKDRALATIRTLREKEKTGKATQKQLDDALARLKEIEDKDKSESERLAGTAKEASEKLTAAEARAQDLAIRLSVERAARKLNFIDEDDAYRLIDRRAVEMDDNGDPTNVDALLTALSKAKPHLVKADDTDDKAKAAGSATRAVPPTPKPAQNGSQSREQDIDTKARVLQQSGAYPRF